MRHSKTISLSFAALSALLVALALPNEILHWGSPLLGLVALVPLFIAIAIAPKADFVLLVGGVFGFLYHGITSYWLWFFRDFRFWTLGSTSIACFFIYAGVAAWLWVAARSSRAWRPVFLAIGWVGYEYMKSRGFLAYPWGILGYSWNTVVSFNQIADITGIYGPSLIIAFTNSLLAEGLLRFGELTSPSNRSAAILRPTAIDPSPQDPAGARKFLLCFSAALLFLFAASFGYGAFRLSRPAIARKTLSAVVVQPNEDSWKNGNEGNRLQGLIDLTEEAMLFQGKKPDIILWTENTLDGPYDEWADKRYSRIPKGKPLNGFIKETGVPLFTGGPKVLSWKPLAAQNAVLLIGADGEYKGHYAKVHPVPFAEAIPFWEYQWMRSFMKKAVGLQAGWELGDALVLFRVPTAGGETVRFAAPICFEDAFADLCRDFANAGAELFVNLTNDSWSKTVSAEIQHLVAARYRSIETRRVLVRSTAAGATCWVDSKGRIRDLLPLFKATSAFYEVPIELPSSPTAYMLAGDAFAIALICIFIFASTILHFMGNPPSRRRKG
jgi:apolipoprotein N-acyltransferase